MCYVNKTLQNVHDDETRCGMFEEADSFTNKERALIAEEDVVFDVKRLFAVACNFMSTCFALGIGDQQTRVILGSDRSIILTTDTEGQIEDRIIMMVKPSFVYGNREIEDREPFIMTASHLIHNLSLLLSMSSGFSKKELVAPAEFILTHYLISHLSSKHKKQKQEFAETGNNTDPTLH